ncbi:CPBP family intramembrane metalloprotease [Bradyrhizobium sp. SK17]|uniref:type II CAAX endopeptidase family protein n=1 Tax=Bradyrhizobium sp. SK17 TaxID=2057741 RepID=UPI000C301F35|nr:type II CAAX endopeptidase family protein [Bradyrhizobium sp. SK17]AUC98520.1 CPBP family intramembrane metalloprotease [Bradyrhizobium sp. SK17]
MVDTTEPVASLVPLDPSRFERFEYPGDDFPYYNGRPAAISGRQWLFVMVMLVAAFVVLVTPIPMFAKGFGQFVPAVLFFAIPLIALAIVVPRHWTALFRRVGVRDIGWMVGFAVLNVLIGALIGFTLTTLSGTNPNAALAGLANLPLAGLILFFLKTIPQLFGEEVFTILPFLALLWLFCAKLRLSRRASIVAAWVIAALLFAGAHLPTYGWNVVQCLAVIGSTRLVLLLPYIMTKSIWVSTGAHILNDWILFILTILLTGPK